MLPSLAALSPDTAILLFTLGAALIAVELNRPGTIASGALGLLLTLLAVASLLTRHPRPEAAIGAALCVAMLLLQSRRNVSMVLVATAAIALMIAVAKLLPPIPGPEISAWTSILSSLVLAAGTTALTRIARRARHNKGLD